MQTLTPPARSGGNPATTSVFKVTKSDVVLALLPIGKDGRGHTFTRLQLQDFVSRWVENGSYPSPVVLTHDQDRDRPAVGWVKEFFVEGQHLKGNISFLPKGEEAFYSTHPGWSLELIIDGNSRIDIRSLSLLGKERPHFKNLTQYSQFYSEMPEETLETNETTEKDNIMDELLDLAESQGAEINSLRQQVEELQTQSQQYEEAAIDAEGEALYAELQTYGCDCDKGAIKNAYSAMGAELRPEYRNTLVSVASSARSLAKSVVNSPKLLYGEEKDKITTVKAKVKLMRLSDTYGKGAE
jgi:hypothetical protein